MDIFAYPLSVNLGDGENSTKITAKIYDDSGSKKATTYKTPITFVAKDKNGIDFGVFSNNGVIPNGGEVEVYLSSNIAGTATITASSGDLILTPEGGIEIVFYESAHHIVLSADPDVIEADGNTTSIIKATICDSGGNKVANYVGSITFATTWGIFPDSGIVGQKTITVGGFGEGEVWVELSSNVPGEATITASSGLSKTPCL